MLDQRLVALFTLVIESLLKELAVASLSLQHQFHPFFLLFSSGIPLWVSARGVSACRSHTHSK
jgi:hypothetical protein